MRKIDLYDGKYTIINDLENGGGLKALRYGEEWRNLAGDNLILALFQELEEAKENIKMWQAEAVAQKKESDRIRKVIDEIMTVYDDEEAHPHIEDVYTQVASIINTNIR